MKNIKYYLFCLIAFSCSVSEKTDDLKSTSLDQYTGVYEGYIAEYLSDTLHYSDSSFQERIWVDDSSLFWTPILGEEDSVAEDIEYSRRMRFNNELASKDTLEDELFMFFFNSTLRNDSLIRNVIVLPKDPTVYLSRQYIIALKKK